MKNPLIYISITLVLIGLIVVIVKRSLPKELKVSTNDTKIKLMFANKEDFLKFILPASKIIEKETGIPYKFIIAQTALETGYGKSTLVSQANNFGGVKAVKGQDFVLEWTYEYVKDPSTRPDRDKTKDKYNDTKKKWLIRVKEPFAKYPDTVTGLKAYAKVLQNKYFGKYISVANKNPYKFVELIQSGEPKYATDVNYVSKIHTILDSIKTV